jgi:hypothetical protein
MKKFTVLVALALLAATGTGYAVTCAQDNVPAATLLVPYFKVGGNGTSTTGTDIPEGGIDTLVAITNVSDINLIAHVTVWNKYSAPVLDFNIPMTGYDVVTFRMKDILNGRLNPNALTQDPAIFAGNNDVCFSVLGGFPNGDPWDMPYDGAFIRFTNPDSVDRRNAISSYAVPAYTGSFRTRVWDSLDESPDYTSMTSSTSYRDFDNPVCGVSSDGVISGDFSGYVTIDVANFCTNYFPSQAQFYYNDAIATIGWGTAGGPNVLMGDTFFVDPAVPGGNISGDPVVHLEFDSRLDWFTDKTFYDRYYTPSDTGSTPAGVPSEYVYRGDGREPLGYRYGFRFLNDSANGLQTWATIWRSDVFGADPAGGTAPTGFFNNLCPWYRAPIDPALEGWSIWGFSSRAISVLLFDEDENTYSPSTGGPSGGQLPSTNVYVYLEAQRLRFASNATLNPAGYKFGWTSWTFNSVNTQYPWYRQAWVGIQHSAPGNFISVGHDATLLNNQFTCELGSPYDATLGNVTE